MPSTDDNIRKVWDNLPKGDKIYGWDGTSNRTPAEVLDKAGVPYTMPPGAIGIDPMPIVIPIPGQSPITVPRFR